MKHNFNAGPSILPKQAIDATVEALKDFNNSGLSIAEISHRSAGWDEAMDECRTLWKELLSIPDGYEVLFLHGGASQQFLMLPYNLLQTKAAYLDTGVWATKAIEAAKYFGEVQVVASGKDSNYSVIPKYEIPADADYFHFTSNNTIFGTEIRTDPDSPVNMVSDMSSDILSRPIDVSKYAMIYGGAQKNAGTAGLAFVIIRQDVLGKVSRSIPAFFDYRVHIKNKSMYNTPPVIPIFMMKETLKWLKSIGGVAEIEKRNRAKADCLYNEIDRNPVFRGTTAVENRSIMNVCFVLNEKYAGKDGDFMELSKKYGITGIKGHRSVGGFRASLYNALPLESVETLVGCMKEFEKIIA
ncbi:MAG: 3-phosphoserine/phosphohydroxythreonine transaminase [Prevotellaceae bacterium]|jgi:phosphoserine aminotransferase|nr:3-phosphoserine/phosphohydroxythreonine transaminase [Prevotellaceae bacterium]